MTPRLKWISLLAGIVALWMTYRVNDAPYIPNDGYQYLDAAANLASGKCLCTNVALFDEQVAYGHMPIPLTHFAPGYPVLMAAISRFGVTPLTAGYLLSAAGYLITLWLIWDVALGPGAKGWVVALASLIWLTHASALLYAATIGAESLFAALLMAVAALITRDVRRDVRGAGAGNALPCGIGLVAGFSYWIRYPGLFLVAGAAVYLVVRLWRRPQARAGTAAGLVALLLLVLPIQIRNAIYAGSWQGGFSTGGHQSAVSVIVDSLRAFRYLLLGDRVPLRFDAWAALFFLSAATLLFLIVQAAIKGQAVKQSRESLCWSLFIGFVYVSGVLAAALLTIAGDFARYFLPVYPLLIACFAVACSRAASGVGAWVAVLAVLSMVAIESRGLPIAPHSADWIYTRALLNEDVEPSVSLVDWLRDHVQPADTIVAVEGQAVHFVVQRPVVAALEPRFSSRPMDEKTYLDVMRTYHAKYLVVFPGAAPERVPDQESSTFLHTLDSGTAPSWLRPAVHSRDAAVYECTACGR